MKTTLPSALLGCALLVVYLSCAPQAERTPQSDATKHPLKWNPEASEALGDIFGGPGAIVIDYEGIILECWLEYKWSDGTAGETDRLRTLGSQPGETRRDASPPDILNGRIALWEIAPGRLQLSHFSRVKRGNSTATHRDSTDSELANPRREDSVIKTPHRYTEGLKYGRGPIAHPFTPGEEFELASCKWTAKVREPGSPLKDREVTLVLKCEVAPESTGSDESS